MKEPEEYKWKGIPHFVRWINAFRSWSLANVLTAGKNITIDEDSNHSKTISATGSGGSGSSTQAITLVHLGEIKMLDVYVDGTFYDPE